MTFDDFFNQYNGKSNVGNTTENKGQCVGLEAVWCDILGLPHIWGNACDLFANADEKFYQKILNTPDFVPQKGDIAVFSAKFNGTVGHTGVCTGKGDLKSFECFEQNDPIGSACQLKTYKYTYLIGCLRPIVADTAQIRIAELEAQVSQSNHDRDAHWTDLQSIKTQLSIVGEYSLKIIQDRIESPLTTERDFGKKEQALEQAQKSLQIAQNDAKEKEKELIALKEEIAQKSQEWAQTVQEAIVENQRLSVALQEAEKATKIPDWSGWKFIIEGIYKLLGR